MNNLTLGGVAIFLALCAVAIMTLLHAFQGETINPI